MKTFSVFVLIITTNYMYMYISGGVVVRGSLSGLLFVSVTETNVLLRHTGAGSAIVRLCELLFLSPALQHRSFTVPWRRRPNTNPRIVLSC